MKAREVLMRCFKARMVSWLTISQQGAVIPTTDGGSLVMAVYNNGRYVEPNLIRIPNDPGDMANWGPDGPLKPPEAPPAEDGGNKEG